MSLTEPIDPPPDWSQASTPEICCPLCEYNLRGLTQPRCPECGFAFSWAELIQGLREQHPYLFEHQPKRNIWSFWKTYWNDCKPQRFWKQLNPAQPVRMKRLIVYWVIANLALIASFLVPFGWNLWDTWHSTPAPVVTTSVTYSVGPSPATNPFMPRAQLRAMPPMGVIPTLVRTVYTPPQPTFSQALQTALVQTAGPFGRPSIITATLIVLAWPWVTLASLLVFVQSMRRAKIRKRHVLRTVIYGTDFGVVMILLFIAAPGGRSDSGWPMFIAFVCAAITLYRVYFAYSSYLRFHMPFATVLASQTIVFLAVWAAYMQL